MKGDLRRRYRQAAPVVIALHFTVWFPRPPHFVPYTSLKLISDFADSITNAGTTYEGLTTRIMRIHQLFLFSLAFALRAKAASANVANDEAELKQLTEDNFKASTSQGLW